MPTEGYMENMADADASWYGHGHGHGHGKPVALGLHNHNYNYNCGQQKQQQQQNAVMDAKWIPKDKDSARARVRPGTATPLATVEKSRARRQAESSLIHQIQHTLSPALLSLVAPEFRGRPLDKATVLRLALCYMKLKRILEWAGVRPPPSHSDQAEPQPQPNSDNNNITPLTPKDVKPKPTFLTMVPWGGSGHGGGGRQNNVQLPPEFTTIMELALGDNFLLIITPNGLIIYASRGSLHSLGVSSIELMGKSIYEYAHRSDQPGLQYLLSDKRREERPRREETVRLRAADKHYRMFHIGGKLFCPSVKAEAGAVPGVGPFFLGLVEPVSAPPPMRMEMMWNEDEQIFVSYLRPDLRAASFSPNYDGMRRYTGYDEHEALSLNCVQMLHPEDTLKFLAGTRRLAETGECVEEFRTLRKYGGYVELLTHSTSVDSKGRVTTLNPIAVICKNYVLNVTESEVIVSDMQVQLERTQTPNSDGACEWDDHCEFDDDVVLIYDNGMAKVSPISPMDVYDMYDDGEASALNLVPGDELDVLEEYLAMHTAAVL